MMRIPLHSGSRSGAPGQSERSDGLGFPSERERRGLVS